MSECYKPSVNYWIENNCLEETYQWTQNDFDTLFENTYPDYSNGVYVPGVSFPESNFNQYRNLLEFQYMLIDICNTGSNGRFCRQPLTELCSSYVRKDTENPVVRSICGCYLTDIEYSDNGARPCDSICSSFNTI